MERSLHFWVVCAYVGHGKWRQITSALEYFVVSYALNFIILYGIEYQNCPRAMHKLIAFRNKSASTNRKRCAAIGYALVHTFIELNLWHSKPDTYKLHLHRHKICLNIFRISEKHKKYSIGCIRTSCTRLYRQNEIDLSIGTMQIDNVATNGINKSIACLLESFFFLLLSSKYSLNTYSCRTYYIIQKRV